MYTDNTSMFSKNFLNVISSNTTFIKITKSIVIIIILTLLAYYYWKFTRIVYENEDSRISILLYVTYVTLNIILIIVCFFNYFMGHEIYTSFKKNIAYVDYLSNNLELSYKDYENTGIHYKEIIIFGTTLISYIIFYNLALTENDFPSIDFTEIACIPLVWLLIFQINFKLNHILRRFNYIKNILETYLDNSYNVHWIYLYSVGSKQINILNRMHLFTYIAFIEVCSNYNIQLLVLIPRVIFYNVLPVHYNIVTALVADERNASHKWSQICTMSVIIFTIWPVIHLVKCTSNTIQKV